MDDGNLKPQDLPFESAREGSVQLRKDFVDWNRMLANRSLELSFGILAANWAVHSSSTDSILQNQAAKWSVVVVCLFLGFNLILTRLMTGLYAAQYRRSQANPDEWQREFDASRTKKATRWPYSTEIEHLGSVIRELRAWVPIGAGLLFFVSLFGR